MNDNALEQGLCLCPRCQKSNMVSQQHIICTRCHYQFDVRAKNSLQLSLAWTIAAIITFIPANLLPIMVFTTVTSSQENTVLEGINVLIKMGMLPIALVVFIASFVVPVGKIISLLILIQSVYQGSTEQLKQRTMLYRIVSFLGPWSMLDVFVVTIMSAVVNLGVLTTVSAGYGLTFFTLMVIFTMFAAESFDPRLIWDSRENDDRK